MGKFHCFKYLCLAIVVCDVIISTTAQQKKPKKKGSTDGKWRPTNRRPVVRKPTNRRPSSGAPRPGKPKELIFPVLRPHKDEPPLQDPSWIHCINNIEVSSNWATIRNAGYTDRIHGQYQCTWIFHGVPGSRVRISFETIDLQEKENGRCASQFVDVIDLEVRKSQGRFCGSKVPGDYVTLGSELRIDLQADITVVAHRGFMASVRIEPKTLQPGLRDRSLRAQGPVTSAPTLPPRTRPAVRRKTTTTQPVVTVVQPNQPSNGDRRVLYGPNYQPGSNKEENTTKSDGGLNVYVYILIAVGCFIFLMVGTAYIFRRSLIKRVKKLRGEDDKFDDEKKIPRHNDDCYEDNYRRFPLPQHHVTHGHDDRRRRSVIFEDEYLAALEREGQSRDVMNPSFRRSASLSSIHNMYPAFQGWNYPFSEPVYDEDRQSVRSVESVRSSMRHPEHEQYKRMKQIERNNSLKRNDEYDVDPYVPKYIPSDTEAYYDDTIDIQRQQGEMMMHQLSASQSMNDVAVENNLHKSRATSIADIPVEGTFLKRQMLRRQSFHM